MSEVVTWVEKACVFGLLSIGTAGALKSLFERKKRTPEEAAESKVMERVRSVFLTLGFGVSVTSVSAVYFFTNGHAEWLMVSGKWTALLTSLGITTATFLLTQSVPRKEPMMKLFAFGTFNAAIGFSLSPLLYLGGPLLTQAAGYTAAITGSLCYAGVVAPSRKFFFLAAPLASAMSVIALSSLAAAIFPRATLVHGLSLYGGLAAFSLYLLYDTNVMIERARRNKHFDPVDETMTLYLDVADIFVRVVRVLAENKAQKRKKDRVEELD